MPGYHHPMQIRLGRLGLPFAVLAFVTSASGCKMNTTVKGNVAISCTRQSECPTGFECRTSVGYCFRLTTGGDREAPRLVESAVTPAHLRRGTSTVISVRASEPLNAEPTLTLSSENETRTVAMTMVESGTLPAYEATVTTTDDDVEGVWDMRVDLLDKAGNAARQLALGTLTFDFTAPSATLVQATPSAVDGLVVLRAADTLNVRLQATEAVSSAGLTLVGRAVSCAEPEAPFELVTNGFGFVDFRRAGPVGADACDMRLFLSGLTDNAGNVAGEIDLGVSFKVDGVGPAIRNLKTYRVNAGVLAPATEFSRQPGFNAMALTFDIDEGAVRLEARIGAQAVPGCDAVATVCSTPDGGVQSCRCDMSLQVGDAFVEGPSALTVFSEDLAHNTTTATTLVTFDYSPPKPSGNAPVDFIPLAGNVLQADLISAIGPKTRGVIFVVMSEPVAAPPTLTRAGLPISPGVQSGGAFSFATEIPMTPPSDGCEPVTYGAMDRVGNAGSGTLPLLDSPCGLRTDWTPPVAPAVTTPGMVRYIRTPWGSRESGYLPEYKVVGAPGAVVDDSFLQVLQPLTLAELARVTLDAGNPFGPVVFPTEREGLLVRTIDFAGNASTAVRIRDYTVVLTTGPRPDGGTANPIGLSIADGRRVAGPATHAAFAPDSGLVVEGGYVASVTNAPGVGMYGPVGTGLQSRAVIQPGIGRTFYPSFYVDNLFIPAPPYTTLIEEGYVVQMGNTLSAIVVPTTPNAGPLYNDSFELLPGARFGTKLIVSGPHMTGPSYRLLDTVTTRVGPYIIGDGGTFFRRVTASLDDPQLNRSVLVSPGGTWAILADGGIQILDRASGVYPRLNDGGVNMNLAGALLHFPDAGKYWHVAPTPVTLADGGVGTFGFSTWEAQAVPNALNWNRIDGGGTFTALGTQVNRPCMAIDPIRGRPILIVPPAKTFEWNDGWDDRSTGFDVGLSCSIINEGSAMTAVVHSSTSQLSGYLPNDIATVARYHMHDATPSATFVLYQTSLGFANPSAIQKTRFVAEVGADSYRLNFMSNYVPRAGVVLTPTYDGGGASDGGAQNPKRVDFELPPGSLGGSTEFTFTPSGVNGLSVARMTINYVEVTVDYRVQADGGT